MIQRFFMENQDAAILIDDGIIYKKELINNIILLQSFLIKIGCTKVLLYSDDYLFFISSILACYGLDIEIIIPASNEESFINDIDADVLFGDFTITRKHNIKNIEEVKPLKYAIYPLRVGTKKAKVTNFTSGSTGKPKEISRTFDNFFQEIESLETLWGNKVSNNMFLGTVSYHHVYGLLFKILWPLLTSKLIYSKNIIFPESLAKIGVIYKSNLTVISSPAFLSRIDEFIEFKNINLIFASGGPFKDKQGQKAIEILQVPIIQVYGSTETGAIAYKEDFKSMWKLLPKVQIKIKNDLLWVLSSYCYKNAWYLTNDFVTSEGGSFILHGRADNIVKIEEKRVSLSDMSSYLIEHEDVEDAVFCKLEDKREYLGALVVLVDRAKVNDANILFFKKILKEYLRNRFEALFLPKKIRFVESIPVNSQGKVEINKIKAFFDADPKL